MERSDNPVGHSPFIQNLFKYYPFALFFLFEICYNSKSILCLSDGIIKKPVMPETIRHNFSAAILRLDGKKRDYKFSRKE